MKYFLSFSLLLLCSLLFAQKNYTVNRIDIISIDGDLSEWTTIPFSEAFVIHDNGDPSSQITYMKLAWDSDNLYLAYKAMDSDIKTKTAEQDATIYASDDLVEFFIDPDGDGRNYIEVGISARNVYYDYLIKCPSNDCGGWSDDTTFDLENFESATSFEGTLDNSSDQDIAYRVEIKIPFTSLNDMANSGFSTPINRDIWNANFFRIDRSNSNDNTEYQSWNPHHSFGYHQPDKFGTITFNDNAVTRIDNALKSNIEAYPNPTNGKVSLTNTVEQISVFDGTGRSIVTLSNSDVIDLMGYSSGIYLLKFTSNGEAYSEKIILEQ